MRVQLPSPYEGLNLRDGSFNLTFTQAYYLLNGLPRSRYVESRKGSELLSGATETTGGIRTTAAHPNGTIAVAHGSRLSIWSTATETFTTLNAVIGLTTTLGIWNYTQHTSRIILCNGLDTPRVYDGAAYVALTVTSGPVATSLWGCQTFKGRVFYWYENGRSFWYPAAGSYQGVFNEYSLASFVLSDASLVAVVPITIDGGAGADDLAAFVFNNGEVLLYQGDDPADVNAWSQVGRFRIPQPLGPMGWCINGSASLVATKAGTIDLARALSLGPIDNTSVVGAGLAISMNDIPGGVDTNANRSLLMMLPNERLMLWARFQQTTEPKGMTSAYMMDVDTRGWCEVDQTDDHPWGINFFGAFCIAPNGSMYMGSVRGVGGANFGGMYRYGTSQDGWYGAADSIVVAATSGLSDLGAPGQRKQIGAIRLLVDEDTLLVPPRIGFVADTIIAFGTVPGADSPEIPITAWSSSAPWVSCSYNGFQFSANVSITVGITQIRWYGMEVLFTLGGDL